MNSFKQSHRCPALVLLQLYIVAVMLCSYEILYPACTSAAHSLSEPSSTFYLQQPYSIFLFGLKLQRRASDHNGIFFLFFSIVSLWSSDIWFQFPHLEPPEQVAKRMLGPGIVLDGLKEGKERDKRKKRLTDTRTIRFVHLKVLAFKITSNQWCMGFSSQGIKEETSLKDRGSTFYSR